MPISSSPARKGWLRRVTRSRWLRPFNDAHAWESVLSGLNPMWSRRGFAARVIGIVDETEDTKSFLLRPSRRWPQHLAGQHVVVETEIEGRRLHRSFSISSAPSATGTIRITVKLHAESRVARWMHAQLAIGGIVRLSAPAGQFIAPEGANPLLLLSAGSGVTPIVAILQDQKRRNPDREIVLIHSCRRHSDWILKDEIRALAADWPALRVHVQFSSEGGRLDVTRLRLWAPQLAAMQAMVCGPTALVDLLHSPGAPAGLPQVVMTESYSGRVFPSASGGEQSHPVHFELTEHLFTARGDRSLLEQAELAGLKPAHGCRIGICKSCQCLKRSGSVLDLRTGKISSEPDELIQLCISAPRSALNLAL